MSIAKQDCGGWSCGMQEIINTIPAWVCFILGLIVSIKKTINTPVIALSGIAVLLSIYEFIGAFSTNNRVEPVWFLNIVSVLLLISLSLNFALLLVLRFKKKTIK